MSELSTASQVVMISRDTSSFGIHFGAVILSPIDTDFPNPEPPCLLRLPDTGGGQKHHNPFPGIVAPPSGK